MADIRQTMRSVAHDLWRVPLPEKTQPVQSPCAVPAFEEIWKAVDECIDWTAMLAEPSLQPELAPLADGVLAGDTGSYRAALDLLLPLSDLTAYYTACTVDIISADMLSVDCVAAFASADRRRACGMALRAARDLLAALPVSSVQVCASHTDGAVLEVCFTRDALRHIRVNIADPEAIAAQCGKWI